MCENRPAFFCSIQFVKQSSVLLARAFTQKTRSLLVEQALLSLEAKLVQPASPCNHLQVSQKLPEWLLFDFLTLTLTADKGKDNPHLRLPLLTCAFGGAEAKQVDPSLTAGH